MSGVFASQREIISSCRAALNTAGRGPIGGVRGARFGGIVVQDLLQAVQITITYRVMGHPPSTSSGRRSDSRPLGYQGQNFLTPEQRHIRDLQQTNQ
ncbi:hypothetical protein OCU04_003212 [Sclerotinia nivalis]|uniref:Uncharacterized protein n=1 Tax=Sclerotinia nivalis TaxID=352851 RepID=A0A9X0ARI1_9HELO|nr:hypothetical protein OCU04_003212 [Sclerotinia nivalis]